MNARTKLNTAYVQGSLIVAAVFGFAFQSFMAFLGVAATLIVCSFYSGDIRPTAVAQRRR